MYLYVPFKNIIFMKNMCKIKNEQRLIIKGQATKFKAGGNVSGYMLVMKLRTLGVIIIMYSHSKQ